MAPKKSSPKVNVTKNYRMFERSDDNRPVDLRKHKKLSDSMKKYGFLACFPIVCRRVGGKLIVKDGQHRLAIAETLGLPVYWMEEEQDFCIAEINSTPKTWQLMDYAQTYAAKGVAEYQEAIDFADQYQLSIGTAVALLCGTTSFGNVDGQFYAGKFKPKDREWASAVATLYSAITKASTSKHNKRLIEACMGVCRVQGFDPKRLIHAAEKNRERLVSFATREAYIALLDELYNFSRSKRVPLKFLAEEAMRERNAVTKAKAKSNGKHK